MRVSEWIGPGPNRWAMWLVSLVVLLAATSAAADSKPAAADPGAEAPTTDTPAQESGQANDAPAQEPAPEFTWQKGPSQVDLGHDLQLALPAEYAFLAPPQANKLLEKFGNFHNEGVLGLISGTAETADWVVVVRYDDEGYIKDDEDIDADEILSAIREGSEAANEEREKRGFLPLTVDGWASPPAYDKAKHHLTWALTISDKDGKSVNYNTRILGRRGYVSLNLVTAPENLNRDKPAALALLAATTFKPGARYADFNPETDKVAEYGLAGIVMAGAGVGAAKLVKLGLFAKFWKLLLGLLIAGKKVFVFALIGLGALVKGLVTRARARKQEQLAADVPPPSA